MFSTLPTALLWWPVITYFVGVVVALAAGGWVWRTDEQVRLLLVVRTAVLWPIVARGLFR